MLLSLVIGDVKDDLFPTSSNNDPARPISGLAQGVSNNNFMDILGVQLDIMEQIHFTVDCPLYFEDWVIGLNSFIFILQL